MVSALLLSALIGLSAAAPRPQLIDTAGVEAAPKPVFVTPAYDVPEQAGATHTPAIAARSQPFKRDGTCASQPSGSGLVTSPDTPEAFLANPTYTHTANNAVTPDGYTVVMQNGNASLSASNYMGLTTLTSYDTLGCASRCDQASGCEAFNMYIERDPTLDPNADSCPNPPSLTNYKCTLWGAPVSATEATNNGQWRDSFQVVIAGSNAYNKASPPSAVNCFDGPTELGGAINAPLNQQGQNTYMGYKYHPFSQTQGYDPSTCAADCTSQTAYDSRHPAADGSYQTCVFFNAYVLSLNSVPQGLYCSLYNQTWIPSYATNYGQYRGSDRYTVSRSYSYSLISSGSGGSLSCGGVSSSVLSSSSTSQSSTQLSSSWTLASQTPSALSISSAISISVGTATTSSPSSEASSTDPTSLSSSSSSLSSISSTVVVSSTSSSALSVSSTATSSSLVLSSDPAKTVPSISSSTQSSSSSSQSSTSSSTSTSLTTKTTSTSATSIATNFCLLNPSSNQYASLSKTGNGLAFSPTTAKSLPSLFNLDSSSRLISTVTGLIAVLQLPTFGKDGSSEGHVSGTTVDQLSKNPNYVAMVCDVSAGTLMCQSAAYAGGAKGATAAKVQVETTTKGNNGVDQYVFAPTNVNGAVAIKVASGSACGPNYS